MEPSSIHVVFAVFPNMTQLDFTGPHQVLSRLPGATVTVASRDGGLLEADGLTFAGLDRLSGVAACDVVCVPGGPGTSAAMLDDAFLAEIRRLAAGARFVTSFCTGSLVLGAAGLLKGRRATSHWASIDLLSRFGAIPERARVVRDSEIVTGGGVTSGIDFALVLVAEIAGPDVAQAIQLSLEYAPAPPFDAGSPQTAPAAVLDRVKRRIAASQAGRTAVVEEAASRL